MAMPVPVCPFFGLSNRLGSSSHLAGSQKESRQRVRLHVARCGGLGGGDLCIGAASVQQTTAVCTAVHALFVRAPVPAGGPPSAAFCPGRELPLHPCLARSPAARRPLCPATCERDAGRRRMRGIRRGCRAEAAFQQRRWATGQELPSCRPAAGKDGWARPTAAPRSRTNPLQQAAPCQTAAQAMCAGTGRCCWLHTSPCRSQRTQQLTWPPQRVPCRSPTRRPGGSAPRGRTAAGSPLPWLRAGMAAGAGREP